MWVPPTEGEGACLLESRDLEKDFRVIADQQFNMTSQHDGWQKGIMISLGMQTERMLPCSDFSSVWISALARARAACSLMRYFLFRLCCKQL